MSSIHHHKLPPSMLFLLGLNKYLDFFFSLNKRRKTDLFHYLALTLSFIIQMREKAFHLVRDEQLIGFYLIIMRAATAKIETEAT